MLNQLVAVAFSLALANAVLADDISASTDQREFAGEAASDVVATRIEATVPQELLMAVLAAAVFGFQLRRKFRASTRAWQRLVPAGEVLGSAAGGGTDPTPVAEPAQAFASMQLQRNH